MAPMSIRRATNSCSTTYASCSSDNTGFDPSLAENQGPHRFIGVGMVAGLILIIFLVWLYLGRWPRKMLQQYCCCCRRPEELPNPIDDETPPIQTTSSSEKDQSTPRGSEQVEEMSAGMVVFTKVPKALRAKERVEWEMDHVNGIRLEVTYNLISVHCPCAKLNSLLDTNSTLPSDEWQSMMEPNFASSVSWLDPNNQIRSERHHLRVHI